jgi:hypothetical protein
MEQKEQNSTNNQSGFCSFLLKKLRAKWSKKVRKGIEFISMMSYNT